VKARIKSSTVISLAAFGWFLLVIFSGNRLEAWPSWFYPALLPATAIGIVGFSLMMVAFAVIFWQGGWKRFNQQDPQKKWTLSRCLLVVGAGLCVLWTILLFILSSIAVGFAWLN
jgi:hypothetical protein